MPGGLFSKSFRKQNPRKHGGHVITAKKSPVNKYLFSNNIHIPKGCSLVIYKNSMGVASKAILRDHTGKPMKTFYPAGKSKGYGTEYSDY